MTATTLKIGVAGVRGVAGVSLTPTLAASFASAFGTYGGPRRIVVGADARPSRAMVVSAVHAGLLSVGCTPVDLGVVPVPAVHHALRTLEAGGGIFVGAGDRPPEWNALRCIGGDGLLLRPDAFAELLDLYHQGIYPRVAHDAIPPVEEDGTAAGRHLAAVCDAVDADRIRSERFRVVVEERDGAVPACAVALLRRLGCEIIGVRAGHMAGNAPAADAAETAAGGRGAACDAGADVGFVQDAEGHRLGVADARGRLLDEDAVLALAVGHVVRKRPGPIVVSVATSRMIDEVAASAGVPVFRTPVGEAHVLARMLACEARAGGEGDGGVIVPGVTRCRDSFLAMALLLEAMAEARTGLSELRETLPRYAIIKRQIPCRTRDAVAFLRLARQIYADTLPDLTDGVKVTWPDRWLHLRVSQSEPLLRIMAEAPEAADAEALIAETLDYFRPAG